MFKQNNEKHIFCQLFACRAHDFSISDVAQQFHFLALYTSTFVSLPASLFSTSSPPSACSSSSSSSFASSFSCRSSSRSSCSYCSYLRLCIFLFEGGQVWGSKFGLGRVSGLFRVPRSNIIEMRMRKSPGQEGGGAKVEVLIILIQLRRKP